MAGLNNFDEQQQNNNNNNNSNNSFTEQEWQPMPLARRVVERRWSAWRALEHAAATQTLQHISPTTIE
jgi:hypothetical protein